MILIIKADSEAQARELCHIKRIGLIDCHQHPNGEVWCRCPDRYHEAAAWWFCKECEAPYPNGTLLWYAVGEDMADKLHTVEAQP